MLDKLIGIARSAECERIRLDSPDFMTAAHGLYHAQRVLGDRAVPGKRDPRRVQAPLIFMELVLSR